MADGERRWRWWLALGATATVAVVLTVLAYTGHLSAGLFEADKAVHFTLAGLLAFFLDRSTAPRSFRWIAVFLVVLAVDEIAQRFSINRTSSIGDYAADVAGVLVFVSASRLFSKTRRAKTADDVAKERAMIE